MYCRNCANPVDDRAVACPKCGWDPRAGLSFCQNCGKPSIPGAMVCGSCGVPLSGRSFHDPRAGHKLAAGICGILIGSLGIHKFILGYTTAGLIMLLATIFTCGVAGLVMHLIGLIEGIIYLTKTDEDFVHTYVLNRREWF